MSDFFAIYYEYIICVMNAFDGSEMPSPLFHILLTENERHAFRIE